MGSFVQISRTDWAMLLPAVWFVASTLLEFQYHAAAFSLSLSPTHFILVHLLGMLMRKLNVMKLSWASKFLLVGGGRRWSRKKGRIIINFFLLCHSNASECTRKRLKWFRSVRTTNLFELYRLCITHLNKVLFRRSLWSALAS